jgi:hypothetical protein
MKRILSLTILISALAVHTPAAARDLFVDNLAGYTVEANILSAPNCDGAVFDDVTLQEFEKGLCVFHRPARSSDDTERAIELLDRAQTRGLPPVHQQFAALLTGLGQCASAQRHLDAYRASGNKDLMARTLFCRDRRLAAAELQSMRWDHALFEYAEGLGPTRTLEARLTEAGACYAGALNANLDAECGLISSISEAELNAFVDEAVAEVIEKYFKGVESPITAMFARKLKRAEGLKETAQSGIADLKAGAAVVNAEYDALNRVYVKARDEKMSVIYNAYRDAILRATSILDEFERWKGGLFITSENINLLPKINERGKEIAEELTRVQTLGFQQTAAKLRSDISRVVNGEAESHATIAALCRIYFCELTNRRSMPAAIRACRKPALAGNPLCVGQDGVIKNGKITVDFNGSQSVAVEDLCRSAGVDPVFTVANMSLTTAATCLGQLP